MPGFDCYTTSHKEVNEDAYAMADDMVVICDGCSSSKGTSLGAKILCNLFLEYRSLEAIKCEVIQIANSLNKPLSIFDCTMLFMIDYGKYISVGTVGDYYLNVGEIKYHHTYEDNAPFYFSYLLDKDRGAQWHKNHPAQYGMMVWEFEKDQPIILATDGLTAIQGYTANEICEELSDIKSPNGSYLKRRAKKVLKGKVLEDDVTIGMWT